MSEALVVTLDPPLTGQLREELVLLWVDVSRAGGAVGFSEHSPVAEIRELAEALFASVSNGKTHLVIGTLQGRLVAACIFVPNALAIQRHFMELKRFMVHPDQQRVGIGRVFADRAKGIANDELRLEAVHLTIRSGTGVEHFWEKCGYQQVAKIPHTVKFADGTYRDSLYFVQQLQ